MNRKVFLIILVAIISVVIQAQNELPYKKSNISIKERVTDLLSRMTLQEKVAQTLCLWGDKKSIATENGDLDTIKFRQAIPDGIGEIARISGGLLFRNPPLNPTETVQLSNKIQKQFIEKTRLGIPVIFHEESLHGNQAQDATSFPSPLGLASSWNPELLSEVFSAVAKEVRTRGGHQVLAPVVDLCRDPRWGRAEETLGEDPFLVSRLAVAEVLAYQGSEYMIPGDKVAATLKHFGVHGQPEGGTNIGPATADERVLREVFFPSFKACVMEAGVMCVMPCYNELNGIPTHMNKRLLTGILRNEWGFNGIIVSDYSALSDLKNMHHVVASDEEGALKGFSAGVDVETPNKEIFPLLEDLVKSGKIKAADLDSAVTRILTVKFRLGLFDNPYTDTADVENLVGGKKHRELARKAADESMVLLKNEGNLLPLDMNKIKTIAVIGPNADKCILGGYSFEPRQRVTSLQGIKEKVGNKINILHSEGCRITDKGDWINAEVVLSSSAENFKRISEAVETARKADAVILFLGGNDATSREAWSFDHLGDLASLDLIGEQDQLTKAILETGKPVIAFIFSGPPLSIRYTAQNVPAIVQCWYLGQETGYAVADLLFGDINPGGKLAISIPRSAGHLPDFYNYKPAARRGYQFDDIRPLFPFGFGLSYTTFKYDNIKLSREIIKVGDSVKVYVDITNTGKRKGAETVQLYIHDVVSSVTRPVKELKGFKKIYLEPGERKTVEFNISPESLAFYDLDMNYKVEPGEFEIMVGSSSEENQKLNLQVIK